MAGSCWLVGSSKRLTFESNRKWSQPDDQNPSQKKMYPAARKLRNPTTRNKWAYDALWHQRDVKIKQLRMPAAARLREAGPLAAMDAAPRKFV